MYITCPALSGFRLLHPAPRPPPHFVLCWRLRCVRSERMGTDGSPLSPLIHQEPTASLACSVICLQATLLRKLPRSFSGPYAVLQSWPWRWPWDGQRKEPVLSNCRSHLTCQSLTVIAANGSHQTCRLL